MNSIADDYQQKLAEALDAQLLWLKTSELPKLKEEVHSFQTAFSTLYAYFLRKGTVTEDPYKLEDKAGEIQIPETGAFSESEKQEQLSIRLASYDRQLERLVNSYQFNIELFTLERVRRIRNLISYINWAHLSIDAEDINTRTVAGLVFTARLTGDHTTQSVINGTLSSLMEMTISINKYLNIIQKYNREVYKLELRRSILAGMKETPTLNLIKQKAEKAMPKSLFYPELVEEVLKEDYSLGGSAARAAVLEKLKIIPEEKPKPPKEIVVKTFLLDGVQAIGSIAMTLSEIWLKFEENQKVLENQKSSVKEKLVRFFARIFNLKRGNDQNIYEIKYLDSDSGLLVHEQVNFHDFMLDLEASAKNCSSIVRSAGTQIEPDLLETLDRHIRDLQKRYKTLAGLDEYFKSQIKVDAHNRVKGIKPELSTIKNALIKADEQRSEYLSNKGKGGQFKSGVRH
ncbi:MAG: hypothetical protein LBF87_07685 [Treponema sp.]|jgi:uncharacterized protein YeeX (DUF496 family)|nr:hypothetical protein [Treponema sp.]